MHAGRTVQIDSHAADTLRYIRASMEAAALLRVPGSLAIAAGIVGLLAASMSSIPAFGVHWLIVWIVAAFAAASVGTILLLRHSPAGTLTIAGSPVRKFALGFVPSLAAGAVLTFVLWTGGHEQLISGAWLILYGCALISASATATRIMAHIGSAFFALGVLALLAPGEVQILLLGTGFGALHILLGILIGHAERRASSEQD